MNLVDPKKIAEKLRESEHYSFDINIEYVIENAIIDELNTYMKRLSSEVIQELQTLEHPEPRTKEEYNERYGLDKE